MTRRTDGWTGLLVMLVMLLIVLVLAGCGRDDLGALLVRWPL